MKSSDEVFKDTLKRARARYFLLKDELASDPLFSELLKELKEVLSEVDELYEVTKAAEVCRECGRIFERTCCGSGMELEASESLLVLNLFLGFRLETVEETSYGCKFLGREGCVLLVKPFICRNFFCPWFRERMEFGAFSLLQEAQEKEARLVFRLLDYLNERTLSKESIASCSSLTS